MGGVLDYSTTAASNTTVGGVSIAEGMAPGNVNNGMRAQMADARKWQLDWSGITTAGTGNAYTITSNQGISAYADGQRFSFRADRNNTGAATLNVDGRGAKALRKVTGGALAALVSDDLAAEAVYDVVYDLSSDVFVIVGFAGLQASAFAQTLLDDATAADARTTLGLVIGTDVQAQGATLTSLEGLTLAAGDILYATGADTLVRLPKGTAGQVLQMNSGATAPAWGGVWTETAVTATTSGTAIDFTSLPAGLNEMELWFDQVSVDSTDDLLVQIGTGGTPTTTGYASGAGVAGSGTASLVSATNGFVIFQNAAASLAQGVMRLYRIAGNTWIESHALQVSPGGGSSAGGGRVVLAGDLDNLRLTSLAGTQAFDLGQIRLRYR